MAYGLEYWLPFKSYFDDDIEILIKRQDASSSETYFTADGSGAKIQLMRSSEDKFGQSLFGAMCKVPLLTVSSTQYDELFTTNNQEYKVEIMKEDTLIWTGYGEANFHSRGYDNPSRVEMAFVDGLGRLKDIPFNENETFGWNTPQRLSKIVGLALYQTDLNLPVYESINIYETNMSSGVGDSMLYQTYMYPRAFRGLSCAEVLNRILFGSVLWQRNGVWWIVRINELQSDTVIYRKWDYVSAMVEGEAPDSNSQEDLSIDLVQDSAGISSANLNVFINQTKHRTMKGGWKDFTVKLHNGMNLNLIKDYTGGFTVNGGIGYTVGEEIIHITNPGYLEDMSKHLSYSLGEYENDGKSGNRHLKITIKGFAYGYVRMSIHVVKNSNTYWLRDDGTWYDGSGPVYFLNLTFQAYQEFELELNAGAFSAPVTNGDIYFRIYAPWKLVASDPIPYLDLKYEEYTIELDEHNPWEIALDDYHFLDEENFDTDVSSDNSVTPEVIDVYMVDGLIDNAHLVYDNVMYYKSGSDYIKTAEWSRRGVTNNETYLTLLIQEIVWQYTYEWSRLEGRLKGHFKFGDIVKDIDDKRYWIIDAEYDLRSDEWQLTMLEFSTLPFAITESGESFIVGESGEGPIII